MPTEYGTSRRTGSRSIRRLGIVLTAVAGIALMGACSADINNRGNAPDPERLAQVKEGVDQQQVRDLLGSPTNVSTFNEGDAWYYISQRTRQVAFYEPEIISRQIIAIGFDKDGRVNALETYGLEDGKNVEIVNRTTPTPGRQFTLLQQLFGNFGRFEAPDAGSGGVGRPTTPGGL